VAVEQTGIINIAITDATVDDVTKVNGRHDGRVVTRHTRACRVV
jgi:hypothetical protein